MKIIPISGVIGWDIYPKDIRAMLEAAAGEEVEVQISSPGGFVFEGLEMFNLIRRYAGVKTTFIMGEASSMASYIALAGDRVRAADNITYMIHNVQGVAFGDYREMDKMSEIVGGLSGILAKAYAAKSGKSINAIRALMDDETWYFGEEAKAAGFVDEIVPAPAEEKKDKEAALAEARLHWAACRKIIGQIQDDESLTRAAALAGGELPQKPKETPAVGGEVAARAAETQEEVQVMDLNQLKKEHPDVYGAAVAEGVQQGVAQERARMTALEKWIAADAGNPAVAKIVAEAKATGKTEAEVMAQLQVAVRDAKPAKDGGDNPPPINTDPDANAGGVQLTPELLHMGAQMGVSAADIKKFGGVAKGGK
jgi:ATP-dependent protease ClpP protease subunit